MGEVALAEEVGEVALAVMGQAEAVMMEIHGSVRPTFKEFVAQE